MESGELIAVLIVVIVLLCGTIFLCFRCWRAIGEVADDHMKPKRETRTQMIRGAVRRSFRRAGAGIQRGAGAVRNSFRRARGVPPSAPPPEEPGPPTRPYGSHRGGARRYPGRGSGGTPGMGPGAPGGQPAGPRSPTGQGPGPQPVPSVSGQTPQGPGHSDIHPAYLPRDKRPTSTGSQSDAPPTYQEALSHETAASRSTAAASMATSRLQGNVEVHKSPPPGGLPPPQRLPSTPSGTTPPPIPPAPYPEQLGVSPGYNQRQPPSPYTPNQSRGVPQSPHEIAYSPRGNPQTPQSGYPHSPQGYPSRGYPNEEHLDGRYPAQSPHTPNQRSPYPESNSRQYGRQDMSPSYNSQYSHQSPPSSQSYDRDSRYPNQTSNPRDYHRDHSRESQPPFNPNYPRAMTSPQESREFPHLMTSHPSRDNEYSQPPVPARNYSLADEEDDDGGFGGHSQSSRSRSSRPPARSNIPREYVDYRSHNQLRPSGGGGEDEVDYAGYAQIPPRSVRGNPHYGVTSPSGDGYQNEAYIGDITRQPGDGAYHHMTQGQGHTGPDQGHERSSYYTPRGPLPPVPQHPHPGADHRVQAQYSAQHGVVFSSSDRRHMDSDTYI